MIANLEIEEFAEILHSLIVPSTPVQSEEHSFRNDLQVREIEQELDAPGRTIFVYGDLRGGSRLLAKTAGAIEPNTALTLVLKAAEGGKEDAVVVIDRFDKLTSDGERTRFADLIRQIEDGQIPIRFVFCGVSESVKNLLGDHESCYHYPEDTDLPRVSRKGGFEIIDKTREGPGARVTHYVDLVSEELFWEMFNDPTFAGSLRQANSGNLASELRRERIRQTGTGSERQLPEALDCRRSRKPTRIQ